ncbi:hypothetical protein [Aliarcobacter cryaerophilus]|uniref:hypothetical protein n=1 Tax=Aliarcobacter cryaerophilus TaxID=28198 RepID=UPI0021B21E34|nr:hypothetical protein [Aliarcobacter cryaerophilus]MCT7513667.1 hypothetical protein [Aliarcobacter cryaerophilus]
MNLAKRIAQEFNKVNAEISNLDVSPLNKPVITSPLNGTVDYIGNITSTYSTSNSYIGEQDWVRHEASLNINFTTLIDSYEGSSNLTSWVPNIGLALTTVYVRTRHGSDKHLSTWSDPVSFTTPNIYVAPPSLDVAGAPSSVTLTPTLTGSPFVVMNGTDTHASSDWQALNASNGSVVWESLNDTQNKLSITTGTLPIDTDLVFRVRYNGAVYGSSAWVEVTARTLNIYVQDPVLTVAGYPDSLTLSPALSASAFEIVNGTANHINSDWEIRKVSDNSVAWSSIGDTVNKTSINANGLDVLTQYKIRVKYNSDLYGSSNWVEVTGTTLNIYVENPTITVDGTPNDVPKNPTISGSAFSVMNGSDTHESTDYQAVRASDGVVVWESLANTVNKTSIKTGDLVESTAYIFKMRYKGTTYGYSQWVQVTGTTKDVFTIPIGIQGKKGFAVAPTDQPFALLGLAEMTGTNDPASDNYGNYIHTNGSIVCWLPKTYYRVGHSDSPRFATYGANALDIVGTDVFATEAEANASGYALHRAFINAGKEQSGFFIDKYMNSKDGNTASKSVFGGVPISLATTAGYTVSNGMTGCTGILADAVVLSRARGERWNTAIAFMYGYLAMVSVAQAQAATSTDDVAWYDPTGVKNFPKGCNNNALSDVDDTSVVYATAGDSGNANKPKTGATANFAKTTHNGSNNGVADLNGGMFEVTIGITNFSSSATATTAITNDTIYVLKHSTDIATLTGGWNGATDVWGDATNLATKYDLVTSPHPLGSSTGTVYWGNGTNTVLQNDLNGVNRDVCGFIPKNSSSTGATGANLFGNDQLNKQNIQNMVPLACGSWLASASAGVFSRNFNASRSTSLTYCGFRASAYFA